MPTSYSFGCGVSLCLMFLSSRVLPQLQIDNMASLARDLKIRFHSDCLFLVTSNALDYQQDAVEISKIFSQNATMVAILSGDTLNKTAHEFRCLGNRPLFFLLADDNIRRHLLMAYKVPSYPRWVVILDPSLSIQDFFIGIFVPFDCEMLVAESFAFEIRLTYIYHVAEDSPLARQLFGTWSPMRGLQADTEYLYNTRNDLEGLVLKTTSIEYPPVSVILHDTKRQKLYVDGFYGKLWQILEKTLNFSSELILPPIHEYGVCKDGNCTGMMAMITNGDVHVAVNEFAYDDKRMDYVDFLVPINSLRMSLYVRRPETIRFQWTSFLSPFSPTLWLGILGSILISSASLSLGLRIERRDWQLSDAVFPVFALFCGQGDTPTPLGTSFPRRVLLSVGFASTVVMAAYSGALTSTFTVQVPELPYDTIEEYVDDPKFEQGISPNSFWVYLENAKSGVAKKLREKLYANRNNQPNTRHGGFTKLCNSAKDFGWISSAVYDPKYFSAFKCAIVPVPGYIMVDTVSIILQKGSPYTNIFNHKLGLLRTSGTLSQLYHRNWPESLSNQETMTPLVYFHQVVPILTALAMGMVVSALLVVAEKYKANGVAKINKRGTRNNRRKSV